MKKALFLVFITVMALAGCSKDEDVQQDPIVGKWKLISANSYSNGEIEPYRALSDCEKKSWMTFDADGNGASNSYDLYYDNECIGDPVVLTWVNNGEHMYGVKFGDDEEQDIKITFEGNEMWVYLNYHDGGAEIDEVIVMKRVE